MEYFDTSNYIEDNVHGIPKVNEAVVLKLKDEMGGEIISEFVGLRAKLYSYKMKNEKQIKKLRGCKSCIIDKKITFDDYRKCLENRVRQKEEQCTILNKNHDLFTVCREKITLCPNDDKRREIENYCTLPFGYLN